MIFNDSDYDLVVEAKGGNERAFDILFNRYRAEIYHIALSICGNTAFVEDAVQDAFITAFLNIQQLRDPKSFFFWLKRIVQNCCYQAFRKEKLSFAYDEIPERIQQAEDSIADRLDHLTMRDTLYAALSGLPEHHRITLMLRYLSEYSSYQQIAEITGVPVGTVRSRLSEGRKYLSARWRTLDDMDDHEFSRNCYWNDFYSGIFPEIYIDQRCLPKMLSHIKTDMKLVFTSGKTVTGRKIFEESIYDDFEHGSRVSGVTSCISSGNLSVMNLSFENSPEHPNHCPPSSFISVFRLKDDLSTMRLFHASRNQIVVSSEYA